MRRFFLAPAASVILLGSVCFSPLLAQATDQSQQQNQAQSQATAPPPPDAHMPNPKRQARFMAKKLGMSADQQSQLEPILASRDQQIETLRADTTIAPPRPACQGTSGARGHDEQDRGVADTGPPAAVYTDAAGPAGALETGSARPAGGAFAARTAVAAASTGAAASVLRQLPSSRAAKSNVFESEPVMLRKTTVLTRTNHADPPTVAWSVPYRSLILAAAALPLLAAPLLLAGCAHPQPVVYYPPPPAYSAVAQRAYHDGFVAAQRDVARGLPPDVGRHPRFRNPPVGPPLWEDYRHGFRDGYKSFLHPAPPPGPPPGL